VFRLLGEDFPTLEEAAYVEEGDNRHEGQQYDHAREVDHALFFGCDLATTTKQLNEDEEQSATIKSGEWEKVDHEEGDT
jgi:hypothetical protein